MVIHLLTLTLASPLSQEEEEAVLDSYESLGYHLRQFGRGEKVRWQKKKVKDGSAEPKRARKRKAAEATPAAAMSLDMSPAAQPHPAPPSPAQPSPPQDSVCCSAPHKRFAPNPCSDFERES